MKKDKNYIYFKNDKENLKKKYCNEYVVIYEEKVVFHNINLNKVVRYVKNLEAGKYIIEKCEIDDIQRFNTRVVF